MSTATLRPLHDFIVIQRDEPSTQTDGGILLVQKDVSSDVTEGTVVAVGPGVNVNGTIDPMVIKVGDRVLFSKGTGQLVDVAKVKYLFLKQRDIMGLLR